MIELALAAVAIVQQAVLFVLLRSAAEERRRFLAAVMAKDPGEFVALERATAPKPKPRKPSRDGSVPPQPYGL